MLCPRLHGTLIPITLNADYTVSQQGYLCPFCHGVWLRFMECSDFLGLDYEKLSASSIVSSIPLECPHCQTPFRQVEFPIENGSFIRFHLCACCKSCFLDSAQFALFFYNQVKIERTISGILAQSPLDRLGVICCDCGAEIPTLDDLYDANIGYCCHRCHDNPPILSENKIQNVQLVTFHNMEIKIDHWQSSSRSRIAVTPVEPCLLDMKFFPLHFPDRLIRLGTRKTHFNGFLKRYLDGTESIEKRTPLHVFLKQRGVTSCLEDLVSLGDLTLSFNPQSIIFEMDANRMGTDSKMRFESLVRRMLIAYEKFVDLTQLYSMPTEDSNPEAEKSSDS